MESSNLAGTTPTPWSETGRWKPRWWTLKPKVSISRLLICLTTKMTISRWNLVSGVSATWGVATSGFGVRHIGFSLPVLLVGIGVGFVEMFDPENGGLAIEGVAFLSCIMAELQANMSVLYYHGCGRRIFVLPVWDAIMAKLIGGQYRKEF